MRLCGVVLFVGWLSAMPVPALAQTPVRAVPAQTAVTGSESSAPAASGSAASAAKPPAASSELGGYSWSDKPQKKAAAPRRAAPRRPRLPPHGALATYPGFRVLPNRTSELVVRISKRVDVKMQKASGRVTFVLPAVAVGVRNNTNPLVTTHFDTPLARARLAPTKHGAELVLELREPVTPTFSVSDAPGGGMSLIVTLPPPARVYSGNREPIFAEPSFPSAAAASGKSR